MSKWRAPEYSYDELCDILSDYHKDVHGFRLRMYEPDGANREAVIQALEDLDAHMERQRETFEGREQLRCEGWHVEETDPELAQRATWLAEERDRDRAVWEAEVSGRMLQDMLDREGAERYAYMEDIYSGESA